MKLICYLSLAFALLALHKLLFSGTKRKAAGLLHTPSTLAEVLSSAELFLNETKIRTTFPVPLHGRVDQVFRLTDGRLLILDTKVRDRERIFLSDQIQLTVYAIILKNMGYSVCSMGVIRLVCTGRTTYKLIPYVPEIQVIHLYHRYLSIAQGLVNPTCTCGKHHSQP